ncbi:hypothetical protein ACFQH2_06450 [Natronoarchaeum sp. GCM10025703]|uniref:hypothetical protein n=1 Tax=unclassified Natronoarchaeum TaxID=2620183 RepID=UPI0036172309
MRDQYDVVSPEKVAQKLDADEIEGRDDLSGWKTTLLLPKQPWPTTKPATSP